MKLLSSADEETGRIQIWSRIDGVLLYDAVHNKENFWQEYYEIEQKIRMKNMSKEIFDSISQSAQTINDYNTRY